MEYKKEIKKDCVAVKIIAEDNGEVVGRAWLYVICNGLRDDPYGFLEDIFVEESHRKQGLGGELLKKIIEEAKAFNCYKLVCTSRYSREGVHNWYIKSGFKDYGKEFRMDLK